MMLSWGVAIDPVDRSFYVTGAVDGHFHGQNHFGSWDIFLMKCRSDGSVIWVRTIGDHVVDLAKFHPWLRCCFGVKWNLGGRVQHLYRSYAGGSHGFRADTWLAVAPNPPITTLMHMNIDVGSSGEDRTKGIAIDHHDRSVVISGSSQGTLPWEHPASETRSGSRGLVVIKYSSAGDRVSTCTPSCPFRPKVGSQCFRRNCPGVFTVVA